MQKKQVVILVCVGLISACTPQSEGLPTLVQLPTDGATQVANVVPTSNLGRATLPPTFTPTSTLTETPTITLTATASVTPSATITDTPSPTFTALPPVPTEPPQARPVTGLLEMALQATILPSNYVVPNYQGIDVTVAPTSTSVQGTVIPAGTLIVSSTSCAYFPPAGFGTIYLNNPDIAGLLGCPSNNPPDVLTLNAAYESFQNGTMLWLNGDIYALASNGTYTYYTDTFVAGVDPETSTEVAPAGLFAPMRGFLKVWAYNPTVKSGLGWATAVEVGAQASVLPFQNGLMIYIANRGDVLVLFGGKASGTWRSVLGAP